MSNLRRSLFGIITLGALAFASNSYAVTLWDETTNGDLSNNRLQPSLPPALSVGANSLFATSVGGDREYVRVVIPAGDTLNTIILKAYASNDQTGFVGMQAGDTLTEDPATVNPANLKGYSHFGTAVATDETNVNGDILHTMSISNTFNPAAQGFSTPLGSGNYTFWIQQSGATATYQFDFNVVPEPSTLCLTVLGGLALLAPAASKARRKKLSANIRST